MDIPLRTPTYTLPPIPKSDFNSSDLDPLSSNSSSSNSSTSNSSSKRRKLDNTNNQFEFAPRFKAPPSTITRHSPPDWSESSTFALLDAWGALFLQNGRKSLRSDEWSHVSSTVNSLSPSSPLRSDSQCRNRLDTLKKKYKKEKSSPSNWVYFKKMDSLMSSSTTSSTSTSRLACGVDSGQYVFAETTKRNGMDEMRDSPGDTGTDEEEEEEEESDGLPPVVENSGGENGKEEGFRMLAESVARFGEVYEKIEESKRKGVAELERMRREFQREMEVQKRGILERAQAEIARLRGEDDEEEDGNDGDDDDDDEDDDDGNDGSDENMSE